MSRQSGSHIHAGERVSSNSRKLRRKIISPLMAFLVILVVLGSLTPFSPRHLQQCDTILGWTTVDVSDICTNVAVYLPVGACLYLLLLTGRTAWTSGVIAILLAAMLSLCVEILQAFVSTRFSSWLDIIYDVGGALIGILLARGAAGLVARNALSSLKAVIIARVRSAIGMPLPALMFAFGGIVLWMMITGITALANVASGSFSANWSPFADYINMPFVAALQGIAKMVFPFSMLGFVTAVLLVKLTVRGGKAMPLVIALITVSLACVATGSFAVSGHFSVSYLLLAATSWFASISVGRTLVHLAMLNRSQ